MSEGAEGLRILCTTFNNIAGSVAYDLETSSHKYGISIYLKFVVLFYQIQNNCPSKIFVFLSFATHVFLGMCPSFSSQREFSWDVEIDFAHIGSTNCADFIFMSVTTEQTRTGRIR